MKSYTILIFCLLLALSSTAQRENNERVQSMKIAMITQEINLSPHQAERFWPIFNEGSARTEDIKKDIKALKNRAESLNDVQSKEAIDSYFRLEQELVTSQRNMINELQGVLSDQQLVKLILVGDKFKKQLLKRYKQNRKGGRKQREKSGN